MVLWRSTSKVIGSHRIDLDMRWNANNTNPTTAATMKHVDRLMDGGRICWRSITDLGDGNSPMSRLIESFCLLLLVCISEIFGDTEYGQFSRNANSGR